MAIGIAAEEWNADSAKLSLEERLPPVVTRVSIDTGTINVAPGVTTLRVDFSEPMRGDSFSVIEYQPGSAPKINGVPEMVDDDRAMILSVELEPHRQYAIWLNDSRHANFVDLDDRPLVPYLIGFQTGG